jgi:phospholipid/cholesterol/gamma-HCH transport system permease protein
MLHYIAPITCTLIIVLRSGTAVLTEVALMKINREIDTLHAWPFRWMNMSSCRDFWPF